MKRLVLALVFFSSVIFGGFGQNNGPIDLILLLDTSASMSGSYNQVTEYMTGPFLKEFLRIGDTFHLAPFSNTAAVNISRRIEGRGDVETIIARMLLMYPLDPWSDIPGALSFVEQYASSLPPRRKKIVLISDGDVSFAPGASSRPVDSSGLDNLINETKNRLSPRGIDLEYVKVNPGRTPAISNFPSSGRVVQRPETGRDQSAPGASAEAPVSGVRAERADQGVQTSAAEEARPSTDAAESPRTVQDSRLDGAEAPPAYGAPEDAGVTSPATGGQADEGPSRPVPGGEDFSSPGESRPPVSAPAEGTPGRVSSGFLLEDFPLPLIIALAVLLVLIAGLVIYLLSRQLHGTPNRAIQQAASRPAGEEEPVQPKSAPPGGGADLLASYAASQSRRTSPYADRYTPPAVSYDGPLLLNLFVEDQNTMIGKRNVHAVKPGNTFTVGGGKSDFLIFLVPIPAHIGEVRCDGTNATFIPRKPQYFPDIGLQQVPDCIGKTIRITSDKLYELRFRFERYEDPLTALNRLLRSIQVPG
jgi:hypothetical protein